MRHGSQEVMQEVEVPGPTLTRHCYGYGRAFTLPAYGEPGAIELCCGYVYRIEIARLDYVVERRPPPFGPSS